MTSDKDHAVINTVGLTKIFRDFWGHQRVIAVDNLALEIQPREIYGLLGPNGSGKSTTIKMLLGLLFPSRGIAKVMGKPPGDIKINKRIGYLPEESYLYPFLNARETLEFYGRLFSLDKHQRRQRIDSLLDMVGLASVSRRPVGEYSKGMIRRIGLAQALINDPELLILDEPTSGLDPIGTRQIKDLIIELGRRGKTILLCSHLLADVEDVCDRIGILYGGRLRSEGTLDDLLLHREITQIQCASLSESALAKIRNIIQDEHPEDQLDVQKPRDRLEDYFLRVVSEAQTAQVETSGAIIGGGTSEFLGHTHTDEAGSATVIDQLVAGTERVISAPKETIQPADVVPTPVETVRRDVLDTLTSSDGSKADHSPKPPSQQQSVPDQQVDEQVSEKEESHTSQVDRSVIDSLLDQSDASRQKSTEAKDSSKKSNDDTPSDNK